MPFSRFDINRPSGSQVTAIYLSTNDETRCYDVTNDVTINVNVYLFIFIYFIIFIYLFVYLSMTQGLNFPKGKSCFPRV